MGPLVERAATARADFEADCGHVRALLGAEKPGQAPSTPPLPDAEQERKLRALGYVQ